MRVALIGTRGIPARHGGFETAAEHIGVGLAERGWHVTVYCRNPGQTLREFRGTRLVNLPALRSKSAETLSHTGLSALHSVAVGRPDVAVVFNSGNAPFVPVLHAGRIPMALHVDGLEARRAKWAGFGAKYYRWAEAFAVRHADALIADAHGIADYLDETYHRASVYLPYGAPLLSGPPRRLDEVGLTADGYHLTVARFEPENHVAEIVDGYRRSSATLPLVVVGGPSYSFDYAERVRAAAGGDPRIVFLGAVYDQDLLDDLYLGARSVLHGHSVGGTNPSLLRAMGAGARITAYDCVFNREVTGGASRWFLTPDQVAQAVVSDETAPDDRGREARRRAATAYRWPDVIDGYDRLCRRLIA